MSVVPINARTTRTLANRSIQRIELGEIELDPHRLNRQMRNDLKDDWFPDPFGYSDMLDGGIVANAINRNFDTHHGQYVAARSSSYNIPKPNLCLRFSCETSLADRAVYHGLTSFLVPFYDPLVPWNVFNHRLDRQKPTSDAMFKPGVPAWRHYISTVNSCLSDKSVWLLSTDIKDYYEHIILDRLHRTFTELLPLVDASPKQKGQLRTRILLIFDCLGRWCSSQGTGIPQNRDASSFLANVYMYSVDSTMLKCGYANSYFRYMDDIKIACPDQYAARKALKTLCLSLREIGLSVNSKKTDIIPASDPDRIKVCFDEGSTQVQHIDAMWRSKSRRVILRSLPVLKEYTLTLVAAGQTNSRNFRFCIGKLMAAARAADMFVPEEYFTNITTAIIESLWRHPAATDQVVRYLAVVKPSDSDFARIGELLCDPGKCIYTWQNYLLWSLVVQHRYSNPTLVQQAFQIVKTEDDSPSWAGAALYLGAFGGATGREVVAERFRDINSFLGQRVALIALHELGYERISQTVQPTLRSDLVNVYRSIRHMGERYYSDIDRVPITSLIDVESEYD